MFLPTTIKATLAERPCFDVGLGPKFRVGDLLEGPRAGPLAELDLEEIGDYIVRDNPRRAISFIGEIRDRCFLL